MTTRDHGLVLQPEHADYSDMTTFGTVTIRPGSNSMEVIVSGFDFSDEQSCRHGVTKALAWARDLLDAAVKAQLLVPGGMSRINVGTD
ncbi:hypothetical protein [Luteibacter sp. E-22]|uniref:hypothetical protein n=1 Tax=Luteibacter sp. E-22 TaxID=3404050 RepID=UPI003CEA76A2